MRMSLFAALCAVVLFPARARNQFAADSADIRAAALDYIDDWYAADGARLERALHRELAKRNVASDSTGRSRRIQMSAMTLAQGTHSRAGSSIPGAATRCRYSTSMGPLQARGCEQQPGSTTRTWRSSTVGGGPSTYFEKTISSPVRPQRVETGEATWTRTPGRRDTLNSIHSHGVAP
jgi:hypothetical protein